MSGGSYNYLYTKDADNILDGEMDYVLSAMHKRLAPNYPAAADATKEVIDAVEEFRAIRERFEQQVGELVSRLHNVWRAAEMADSNDGDEADVDKAAMSF